MSCAAQSETESHSTLYFNVNLKLLIKLINIAFAGE